MLEALPEELRSVRASVRSGDVRVVELPVTLSPDHIPEAVRCLWAAWASVKSRVQAP